MRSPPPTNTNHAIADSGCNGHFIMIDGPCSDIQPATTPIHVQLPDSNTITSTHTGLLQMPSLPLAARRAHLFPDLTSGSLLSIGQLCDAGCTALFNRTTVTIRSASTILATGKRAPNGLWTIKIGPNIPDLNPSWPPTTPTLPLANLSTLAHQTASDRIAFLHAAAGYPVPSTWLRAIHNGYFTTWPGLTTTAVKRHLQKSIITSLGHLDQQRANRQSTKDPATRPSSKPPSPTPIDDTDFFPKVSLDEQHPEQRTHQIFAACTPITGQIFSDLPGKFVVPSSRGCNYVLVVYDHDSNAILAEPLKNRTAKSIVTAYQTIHQLLVSRGLRPQLQRLDNEASASLREFLTTEKVDFQLAPPHLHRRNAAERAIRTFKNHFVAILCGADPNFPIHLWDRLLPQVILTLNLLRGSRINPRLSAHAQLHGAFDFNRTPIGPLGTKLLIHEKPAVRESWAPHGVPGWYIGNAPNHYRCYRVFANDTSAERTADTLEWFPSHVPMPKTASIDAARAAASDLVGAIQTPALATPLCGIDTTTLAALRDLADIFSNVTQQSPDEPTSPKPTSSLPRVAPLPRVTPLPRVPHPSLSPMGDTYAARTMNPGQRRRRQAQQAPTAANGPPIMPQVLPTVRPNAPPHPYNTRLQQRLSHRLAHFAANPTPPVANAVLDPKTGANLSYRQLLNGPNAKTWIEGCANEIGRLAQGRANTSITGTNTIHFIKHTDLPPGRKATYVRIVVDIRPQKAEPHRVRYTVGGNLIEYSGNVSTPTADITTAKLVINSVLSTPAATYSCFDISNFYLNTPMKHYKYMRIPVWAIPACMMDQYDLAPLVHNGSVLVEIRKGMYGLPQAGLIAYERLVKHLARYGYHPARHTHGLWTHKVRPILFSLVVDDFGVKTVGQEHANHLLSALRDLYSVTADWGGTKYLGLQLKWNYVHRTCDISMPDYVATALHRFQHPFPKRPEHSPHAWLEPNYGATVQLSPLLDTTAKLSPASITRLQQVVGTLLYYARAVDTTMLVALGTLAAAQSNGTEKTAQALIRLLNYAATNPDACIRYKASDMVLYIHSDASYLSEAKARSRVGGHFFLSSKPANPSKPPDKLPPNNGAIHTVSSILKNVMSSATEAKFAGLFHNARDGAALRTTLIEMGHPQPPTPIQTDNSCASGITNGTVRQHKSKAMDMRFYWVQDRVRQNQFLVYWRQGSDNLGDYFTKHHPTAHHRKIRPTYLHIAAQRANAMLGPTSSRPFLARVCSSLSRIRIPDSILRIPFNTKRLFS